MPLRVLRVADAADHPHQIKERILLAVHANIDNLQRVARSRALDPQLHTHKAPLTLKGSQRAVSESGRK